MVPLTLKAEISEDFRRQERADADRYARETRATADQESSRIVEDAKPRLAETKLPEF